MFSKEERQETTDTEPTDHDILVGFFDLLLKIDMRTNPELYKPEPKTYD